MELTSSFRTKLAPLRNYSHSYDADDNVKPLGEALRELDDSHMVSLDTISSKVSIDRISIQNWLNNESELEKHEIDKLLRWVSVYLSKESSKTEMRAVRNFFVTAGNGEVKNTSLSCESIVPKKTNIQLETIDDDILQGVREFVENKLRKGGRYDHIAKEIGLPLALFQQIIFGVSNLLPHFVMLSPGIWPFFFF